MAKTDWDEIKDGKKKEYSDLKTKQADESIESVNKTYDGLIAEAEEETAKKIDETTDDYVDILRSAGIQKELDLRDIQETRANMGLSRSGLSATEQTAAILSAGNKTAEAQRNRQKAIDSLNDGLAKFKRESDSKRAADILEIEQQRDTDIFNNDQEWDNWALTNKEKEKETNDTNLVTARTAGLIDDETLQLARDNGWSYEEAIKHYAPTKATNDYNNTILGWAQNGAISPTLYKKIMAERPSLETATLWAIDEQQKNAETAAKIETQQKGIEAAQAADDKRESDLYNANEKEWISDDTLKHAIINKLTLQEALVYEDENKKRNNPTDDIYHGAANIYFNIPEGENRETAVANYLTPYDDEYDIGQVYMWLERNAPYTRWAPTKDKNGNVLKSENIGAGGIDRDAVIVDIVTGKRYTGDALYAHYLNYYKNKGLSGENLKAKATNAVLKIQKDAKVIS